MAELLNYTGDAALGLASTPGIPAIGKDDLRIINDASRDMMIQDNERNIKIFGQKIADRDKLTSMIMADQVSTGDILPKYQGQFDQAKKDVEDKFYKWKGNYNDIRGFNEYKESVQHLRDVSAHAQGNTTEIKKLQQQSAAETLPRKKQEMEQWIDKQTTQDFWEPVVPFQQLHDLNMDTFGKFVQPVTTVETPDKAKPFESFDVSKIDFNDIRRRALSGYINDLDQANDIDQLHTKFQNYNQQGLNQALSAMDGQIEKYNKEMGYAPGDANFVDPVKTVKDDNGNTVIGESEVNFAAKYALANQAKYMTRTPKFQKDMATYDLGLKKLDMEARKLGIEGDKARAYVRNLDAKTDKYYRENENERTNVIREYNDFINNVKPSGIVRTNRADQKELGKLDAVFLDDLPAGYQLINGPMLATKTVTDKSGKTTTTPTGKVEVGQLQPFLTSDKNPRPYYIPRYVDPNSGATVTLNDDAFKNGYNQSKSKYPGLSYDDYIRALLKKGAIEMVLKGKNGSANFTSMSQSAKLINAQMAKKGQENVVNPPEGVGEVEQESNQDEGQ